MKKANAVLLIAILLATAQGAMAGGLTVVRHIPGYQCMSLDLTENELLNNSDPIAVREGPSPTSAEVGVAGATVAVASPLHSVNGYYRMLFPTGATVWIEAAKVRPWRNALNPKAACFPSLLSNGKPGFDYR